MFGSSNTKATSFGQTGCFLGPIDQPVFVDGSGQMSSRPFTAGDSPLQAGEK